MKASWRIFAGLPTAGVDRFLAGQRDAARSESRKAAAQLVV